MEEVTITLALSSFIAGVLMFLAPCTLPLVPAYIAYIAGGSSLTDKTVGKHKIMLNSLFYVFGFSCVFVGLGMLAGLLGSLANSLRQVLIPLSGVLVIFFGLQLLHVFSFHNWFGKHKIQLPNFMSPGNPTSSFVIGVAFAVGWTPCIGPILATILLLAGSSATVLSGGVLLAIFALGLAIPFLLTSFLFSRVSGLILRYSQALRFTETLGGLFLIIIGMLLLTNNFELTILYGSKLFDAVGIGGLLDYY